MRGSLLPSALTSVASLYFRSNTSTNSVLNTEWSANTEVLLVVVLVACLSRDTACRAVPGIFTEGLVIPFWNTVNGGHPYSTARSAGESRSLRQWLCSPSRREKDSRPCRALCGFRITAPHDLFRYSLPTAAGRRVG